LRTQQLVREDLRDLTRIQELGQLEMLVGILDGSILENCRHRRSRREVDSLVVRDDQTWFSAEVKAAKAALSRSLDYFQRELSAPHAFQITMDLPFVNEDPFSRTTPTIVPARTLLSQLP